MRRLFLLCGLILMLAACTTPQPTPVPPPAPVGVQPTAPVVVVTLDTGPGATPTPPPAYDINQYQGGWTISFRYEFNGGAIIDQIRFLGGFPITVQPDGTVSGQGSLITAVNHPDCFATIQDVGEIPVTLIGELQQGASGVVLSFQLQPEDYNRVEHYRLLCNTFESAVEFEQRTLWPALLALNAQPYTMPMQFGERFQQTDDVTAATNQQLQATLVTTIQLSR
jgi:hypothetical protein